MRKEEDRKKPYSKIEGILIEALVEIRKIEKIHETGPSHTIKYLIHETLKHIPINESAYSR